MNPGYRALWVWFWKIVDTSKTCKILLYFGKCPIRPLFVSRPNTYEWVSESLKCTKVAVNDFVGCIWMQTKNFTPKNYSELQRNVCYVFWEMTPGYPTWCRVGRVVLSRNDKLLLGEKSPSTYLGIIERGKQLDLGEITFGRVVTTWSPSTYICRNKHDCIWTKLPWVRVVSSDSSGGITFKWTYLCRDRHDCIWTKLPRVGFS